MKTIDCKHLDFYYKSFEGERLRYCAVRGARVTAKDCAKCEEREKSEKEVAK